MMMSRGAVQREGCSSAIGKAVINNGVRFRKRGETIALGGWTGSACLSAVLASRLGYFGRVRREGGPQWWPFS
jgi:hypothetical protein